MNEKVKDQILRIRDTGLTNMFDLNTVQRIAMEMEFYELVLFIEDKPKQYIDFIIWGKTEEE